MKYATLSMLAILALACSSPPSLVDTASEGTSARLQTYPSYGRLKTGNGRCAVEGTYAGSVVLFGQDPCDWSAAGFFQLLGSSIRTWEGYCLDGSASSSPTAPALCTGSAGQSWSLNVQRELVNAATGQCLQCDGPGAAGLCWSMPCTGNAMTQQFSFDYSTQPTTPGQIDAWYPATGDSVCIAPSSGSAGATIATVTCSASDAQWTYDGSSRLVWGENLCLDVGGAPANHTFPTLQPCSGSASQRWARAGLEYVAENVWCLDAYWPDTAGLTVDVWQCGGGLNQQWGGP